MRRRRGVGQRDGQQDGRRSVEPRPVPPADGVAPSEATRVVRVAATALAAPAHLVTVQHDGVRLLASAPTTAARLPDEVARVRDGADGCRAVVDTAGVAWTVATVGQRSDGARTLLAVQRRGLDAGQLTLLEDLARLGRMTLEAGAATAEATSLRTLVGEAVHDLRNPLSVLQAGIDTIAGHEHGLDAAQRARITELTLRQARRMTALLDGLVALQATLETDRLEDVDLAEVVREVLDAGSLVHHPVDVRPDGLLAEGPLPVRGLRESITRLVTNLVTNAAVHGGSTVLVGLRVDGGSVVVTIDDDGPGMPPGTPLDGGTARPGAGGHGLGLAIARRLAEQHGGHVTHRRGDRGGARVEVRLPLVGAGRGAHRW